jgi:hypothetical protein
VTRKTSRWIPNRPAKSPTRSTGFSIEVVNECVDSGHAMAFTTPRFALPVAKFVFVSNTQLPCHKPSRKCKPLKNKESRHRAAPKSAEGVKSSRAGGESAVSQAASRQGQLPLEGLPHQNEHRFPAVPSQVSNLRNSRLGSPRYLPRATPAVVTQIPLVNLHCFEGHSSIQGRILEIQVKP